MRNHVATIGFAGVISLLLALLLISPCRIFAEDAVVVPDEGELIQANYARQLHEALYERFQSWKPADPKLVSALAELLTDAAVLRRFEAPQAETALTFEKSVQTRVGIFYRELSALGLNTDELSPASLARNYSRLYPLDVSREEDVIKTMIVIHCLRSDPVLRESRNRLLGFHSKENRDLDGWALAMEGLREVATGRLSDLQDKNKRSSFSRKLKSIMTEKRSKLGGDMNDSRLYLLPINEFPSRNVSEAPDGSQAVDGSTASQPMSE